MREISFQDMLCTHCTVVGARNSDLTLYSSLTISQLVLSMVLVGNTATDGSAVRPFRFYTALLLNFSQQPVTKAFNDLEARKI